MLPSSGLKPLPEPVDNAFMTEYPGRDSYEGWVSSRTRKALLVSGWALLVAALGVLGFAVMLGSVLLAAAAVTASGAAGWVANALPDPQPAPREDVQASVDQIPEMAPHPVPV